MAQQVQVVEVEQVSPEAEAWAATRVIAMHRQEGRCAQCHRDGCRLYTWADVILRKWMEQGQEVPTQEPAWGPRLEAAVHARERAAVR